MGHFAQGCVVKLGGALYAYLGLFWSAHFLRMDGVHLSPEDCDIYSATLSGGIKAVHCCGMVSGSQARLTSLYWLFEQRAEVE